MKFWFRSHEGCGNGYSVINRDLDMPADDVTILCELSFTVPLGTSVIDGWLGRHGRAASSDHRPHHGHRLRYAGPGGMYSRQSARVNEREVDAHSVGTMSTR